MVKKNKKVKILPRRAEWPGLTTQIGEGVNEIGRTAVREIAMAVASVFLAGSFREETEMEPK